MARLIQIEIDDETNSLPVQVNKIGADGKKPAGGSSEGAGASQDQAAAPPFYKARIWLQRNVTSSRKVVAPLVLKVLHDGAQ